MRTRRWTELEKACGIPLSFFPTAQGGFDGGTPILSRETFANYDPGELLENAEFEDCVFDHCRWLGTRVQNCRFNACTFDHCNFSGVVFSFTMKDAWLLNSAFRSMAWGGLQGSGVFSRLAKSKTARSATMIFRHGTERL